MLLNDMNEFTLLTALNGIKRHFLITVALFLVTLFLLPSLNIIDNRYTMQKVVVVGTSPPGEYSLSFLEFNEMYAIIGSSNMADSLSNTLGSDGVSQYAIEITYEENILLDFKGHEPDNLINTANLIMKRFQSFDEISIQKKIDTINIAISEKRKLLELVSFSGDYLSVSNADLELYASKQKIYNTALENDEDRVETNIDIDKIINIKINEKRDENKIKLKEFHLNNDISNLELIKKIGFTPVSYLYPADLKDISKYYPNATIFFGISLLTALFYNLIMLNFLYIKYKKNV